MKVTPLEQKLIPQVIHLMELGAPYIRPRTYSDYWLYAQLFSSSCPVALADNNVIGAVMAFRSQEEPHDVYVQDVMTHPEHRKQGVATALLAAVHKRAADWGCSRIYLTSEPDNSAAHAAWTSMGFRNIPGDYAASGVSVITAFKGPGKDRAVYQLDLP
jgi:GNAT superfamily N-acetyltransferase